ncbi:MAG: hypothetical protein NUW02_00215 [Candidatus Campbellbacteria bacterium]|nr:hypothetical protein [Candidatus Campbellbacteria bacterium]
MSAWQSRDLNTEPKHYGGGIRAGNLVIAFSGFPEHGDEVIVLTIAIGSGLLEEGGVQAIAEVSSNSLVPILLDELEDELPF